MKTEELISQLITETRNHISRTKIFLSKEELNLNKTTGEEWTILECFEHLNQYFDYYLPEISAQIENSYSSPQENFKPGFIGNYFVDLMLPKSEMKKMKSPKDKNPKGKLLDKSTIEKLIQNFNLLVTLLEKSRKTNLEKVKVSVSIAKFLKIKLGDTFRFLVNHNERHLQQAERIT